MIRIANAPCSWGVLEFDLEGKAAAYPQVLNEIAETGYDGTELGDYGFMPTNPEQLKKELQKRNLCLLGAFIPVAFAEREAHSKGQQDALRTAKLLFDTAGNEPLIILSDNNGSKEVRTKNAGRIKASQGLSQDEWKIFAEGVQLVAETVKKEFGLRTVFHHHCAGYVETPEEIDTLLNLTDENLIGLCLDMGHYRFGGGNPFEALKKYSDRIWHVHFKDCQPDIAVESRENEWDYFQSIKKGIFCELGLGDVDFPATLNELKKNNYNGWIVVEQDVLPGMGSPKDCAYRNRQYIKRIGA